MQGFDVGRFVSDQRPLWQRLESLLVRVEAAGFATLQLAETREFGKLYRVASNDLMRARSESVDALVVDYLNALVARAYAQVHAEKARPSRKLWRFFAIEFPRLFRAEWKLVAVSAALLIAGFATGALAMRVDPGAASVLIPEQHQNITPAERVANDESESHHGGDEAATFSSFLFTHNIQVSFVVFALGLTFGIGTVALLYYNGVPLGALAWQYHAYGKGLFFWAWILPHGVTELTETAIAGAAGLIIARGLAAPGRRRRVDALRAEGARAARLIVGAMPMLILAGVIEGSISQLHAPRVSYAMKLAFAALIAIGVYAYLLLAGRAPDVTRSAIDEEDR